MDYCCLLYGFHSTMETHLKLWNTDVHFIVLWRNGTTMEFCCHFHSTMETDTKLWNTLVHSIALWKNVKNLLTIIVYSIASIALWKFT